MLSIKPFNLGQWMTNCYVVHAGEGTGDECWIIDAGFEPGPMLSYIEEAGLNPSRIVLTHAHLDHMAGVADIRSRYPEIEICLHESEIGFMTDPQLNLSTMLPWPVTGPEPTRVIRHGDILSLVGLSFTVRHTPGHSPGGITLYQEDNSVAFVGDALFAGSIGRYDFPTSDGDLLFRSIREQLLTLPDETRVLPGHGPETTIGQEKKTNPFLQ